MNSTIKDSLLQDACNLYTHRGDDNLDYVRYLLPNGTCIGHNFDKEKRDLRHDAVSYTPSYKSLARSQNISPDEDPVEIFGNATGSMRYAGKDHYGMVWQVMDTPTDAQINTIVASSQKHKQGVCIGNLDTRRQVQISEDLVNKDSIKLACEDVLPAPKEKGRPFP